VRRGDELLGKTTSIDNEFPGPARLPTNQLVELVSIAMTEENS